MTRVEELTTKCKVSSVALGLIRSRTRQDSQEDFIPRVIRDDSPELEELQAQINALR